MNGRRVLSLVSLVFFVNLLCIAETIPCPTSSLLITNTIEVKFQSIEKNLKKIVKDKLEYSSKDNNKVFLKISCSIKNIGNEIIENASISPIELICIDSNGQFIIYSSYKAYAGIADKPLKLKPNKTQKDSTFFLYDKSETPIAIIGSRINHIAFIDEKNNSYNSLKKYVGRLAAIELMMPMIKDCKFSDLQEYVQANNLDFNVCDRRTLPALYYAIKLNNTDVLDGLLGSEVEVNCVYTSNGYSPSQPIHTAIEERNVYAIKKLVEKNADIFSTINELNPPAVIAVRNNYYELLPVLKEAGIDFNTLLIPMNGSPAITVYDFASKRKYNEILDFLTKQNE